MALRGLDAAARAAADDHVAAYGGGWHASTDRHAAECSEPLMILRLLDAESVDQVLQASAAVGRRLDAVGGGPFAGGGLCDELSGLPHDVCFSDEHIALYLHHDGFLQREWPELWAKLHGAMIAPPGSEQGNRVARPLQVRCVELHSYAPGGGLLQPGHRDHGSVLTMSVLLTDPAAVAGGQFVTWREGEPVAHDMGAGDAILFRSLKSHNVATVTRGVRRSLVIELWEGPTNCADRES